MAPDASEEKTELKHYILVIVQASAIPRLCVLRCAHGLCKLRTKFGLVNISWIISPLTSMNPKLIQMVTTKTKKHLSMLHLAYELYCPMLNTQGLLFLCIWSLCRNSSNGGAIACGTACPSLYGIYHSLHPTMHMVGLCVLWPPQ